MKKIVFVLATFLAFGFVTAACSSDKKTKKTPSTITVEVTPSSLGEITASSPTRTLTAVVKNSGVVQPGASVNWVVNPSSFGACVPNQGVSTLFTADTSKTGQGTIIASYNGTNSAPVQFSINQAPLVIDSVAITPNTQQNISSTQTVVFTATAMAGTTTLTGAAYPIDWTVTGGNISPNPSNSGASVTFTPSISSGTATVQARYGTVNSSAINVVVGSTVPAANQRVIVKDNYKDTSVSNAVYNVYQSASNLDLSRSDTVPFAGQGIPSDPLKVLVCDYTNASGGWGGVYIDFTSVQNLSAYTSLKFWVKGTAGVSFEITAEYGAIGSATAGTKQVVTVAQTDVWQLVEYNLANNGVNKTNVVNPFNLAFSANVTGQNTTLLVDYIYFE